MNRNLEKCRSEARARLRFAVVGPLLAAPPPKGDLKSALLDLSEKFWLDPKTGAPRHYSFKTIQRWYYTALAADSDPVSGLRDKPRGDAGRFALIKGDIAEDIRRLRKEHPAWTMQLIRDELMAVILARSKQARVPSYNTVRRFMRSEGLDRRQRISRGRAKIDESVVPREVRRFEVDRLHALWHLDFHQGSRNVLGRDGVWRKPILLSILDDHSRLICHAQWYFSETTEDLAHGFRQALQKRGLPRALLCDNGSAMTSEEFSSGLSRLGIVHETTLPYHPEQNGKQERFFGTVEGRLMAMLAGEPDFSLEYLNLATQAWIEREYHRTTQREMKASPMDRLLQSIDASRACPQSEILAKAFMRDVWRTPIRQCPTITLDGVRFEIPAAYRHFKRVLVRYAHWDLSVAWLVDDKSSEALVAIRPDDPVKNAEGKRRVLSEDAPAQQISTAENKADKRSALLKKYLADFSAHGRPPAYIVKAKTDSESKEKGQS